MVFRRLNLAIPENIQAPLMDDNELVTKKFRISKKDSSSLCRIPSPADSQSWGIPEFCKTVIGFPGIGAKIHKNLAKFLEFQSGSPSIYHRIFNIIHGDMWNFSGTAHYIVIFWFKKI